MNPGPDARRFWAVLALVVVVGAGIRVGYILLHTRHDDRLYDAAYYTLQARALVRGEGFRDPFALVQGRDAGPAADHPPLLVLTLLPAAAISDVDASALAMRFTVTLLGLAAVVATGVLGRTVGGDRVGWVAAGIAALSPNFWLNDGLIMAEAPAVLCTALALVQAYRARARGSGRAFAALGALCALAALARSELALLAPMLVVPLALAHARGKESVVRLVAGLGAALLVVMPWLAFNVVRFEKPVLMSTNEGIALAGSNCDPAYYGERTGYTVFECLEPIPPGDQSEQSEVWRQRAFDYAIEHLDRVPVVVAARVLRTWQAWDPFRHARYNVGEGRPVWPSYVGVVTMWVMFPLVVVGTVVARRRRIVTWPLWVPIAVVTLAVAAAFGQFRFRAPAEPSLAVLAATALVAIAARLRRVPEGRLGERPARHPLDRGAPG